MADCRSVELFAFNFASKNFAYRKLALTDLCQHSQVLCVIFLNTLTKTDQGAQHVTDIGTAANLTAQLNTNLRAVFKCIQKPVIELPMAKFHFGTK